MGNIITVKFIDRQSAGDLYQNVSEPKRVYIRQSAADKESVEWFTTTKWIGGYEADCHIRAGITMRVVDQNGDTLFAETIKKDKESGFIGAEKAGPSSWDAIREMENNIRCSLQLSTHEEWKKWLIGFRDKIGSRECDDNWMYFEVVTIRVKHVGPHLYYLGKRCHLRRQILRHKIASCQWSVYTLTDDDDNTLAICGYEIETENKN